MRRGLFCYGVDLDFHGRREVDDGSSNERVNLLDDKDINPRGPGPERMDLKHDFCSWRSK